MMDDPNELYAQAQALRARAGELEQRAQQVQRATQLRYQAQQLTAQADQIAADVAARYAPAETSSTAAPGRQEQAEKPVQAPSAAPAMVEQLDFRNPADVARYVALSWPMEGPMEGNKNAA
jgi:hypothetical protein